MTSAGQESGLPAVAERVNPFAASVRVPQPEVLAEEPAKACAAPVLPVLRFLERVARFVHRWFVEVGPPA